MEESFVDGSHWIAADDIQGFRVETVFLGNNHNIPAVEPPLWFETMVFRQSADATHGVKIKYDMLRYSTVADALAGRVVTCEKVKSGKSENEKHQSFRLCSIRFILLNLESVIESLDRLWKIRNVRLERFANLTDVVPVTAAFDK